MENTERGTPEPQMIYLTREQRGKLARLRAAMQARSLSHVVSILIDLADETTASSPAVVLKPKRHKVTA